MPDTFKHTNKNHSRELLRICQTKNPVNEIDYGRVDDEY